MTHSLNNRIKYAMLETGIQQKDLAEYMGFELPKGQARISQQLSGKDTDSIKLVKAVSELTRANLLWLITGSGKGFDDQAMDETRLRTMDESVNFIKKFQDKINSMGGIDVLLELLRSNREKSLKDEPTPAEQKEAEEWIKNNLDYVAHYVLNDPDLKEEFEKTTQKKKKLTPPTEKPK